MNKKLNEEQKKLVEENHNLIYRFIRDKHLEESEYYDLLAIALCKASLLYKKELNNAFVSYAWECMKNEYCSYIKYLNRNYRIPLHLLVSYDSILNSREDDYEVEKLYFLEDKKVFDSTLVELEEFFNTLTENQFIVVKALMYGYKETEIAKFLGLTKQRISAIKSQIKCNYKKYKGV